jgi:hypothetical protein
VQGKHASADLAVPVVFSTDGVMPAFLVNIGFRFGG